MFMAEISELEKRMLEKGEVHITGDIDEEKADYLHACLLLAAAEGAPDLKIYIRSPGGEASAGLQMFDEIRHYPGNTVGIVRGFARSAASILLQGCTVRCAYANSEILIHNVRSIAAFERKHLEGQSLKKILENLENYEKRAHEIWSKYTGKSLTAIRKQCALDVPLTGFEAKKFGLIDQVLRPPSR